MKKKSNVTGTDVTSEANPASAHTKSITRIKKRPSFGILRRKTTETPAITGIATTGSERSSRTSEQASSGWHGPAAFAMFFIFQATNDASNNTVKIGNHELRADESLHYELFLAVDGAAAHRGAGE